MHKFMKRYCVVEVLTPCVIFGTMTPGIVGLARSANQPQIVGIFLLLLYATIPINMVLVFRREIRQKLRR